MDKQQLIDYMTFNDLKFMMKALNPGYEDNFHIDLIAEKLMRIVKGEQLNLMISLPPRAGKSFLITEHFPAFYMAHHPEKDIIITAYGSDVATKFSTKVRQVYKEHLCKLNGVELSKDTNAKDKFSTTEGGTLLATGIQGAITGFGGSLIIVDDPIKSRKESLSATVRQAVWEGFQANVWTRRAPGASVVIVQTRWHDDDLIGRIKGNPDLACHFEEISIPALDNSYESGSFFPARFTKQDLLLTKKMLGTSIFEALYQQNPISAEGGIIKKEDMIITSNRGYSTAKIFTSWDLSQSDNGNADYTVCQVWYDGGTSYKMLHQIREKMTFPQTLKKFQEIANKYPRATHLVEGKASGKPLIQMLKNKISKIIEVNPSKSKVMRVEAIAPLFEAGQVSFVSNTYIPELVDEVVSFPGGKHDDMVDTMSQFLNYMIEKKRSRGLGKFIMV